MKLIINNSSMIPIYEQVVEQIKILIKKGELQENDVLPSVRGLASELKISALTVKKAYDFFGRGRLYCDGTWERHLCGGSQ